VSVREWADPEDLYWPLRRVIDHIDGRDLLECGHPMPPGVADQPSAGRRCPVCYAESRRDPDAEISAHKEFMTRFGPLADR
jgi:hypothetical protein